MKQVHQQIELARALFRERMIVMQETGGFSYHRYTRFLSMQYHLTKGVQRHFMAIAAHPSTAKKRNLRKFLIQFAQVEEFHFEIAKADLKNLGMEPQAIPFDTYLWWRYFESILETNPFIRLGATCILENIADGSGDLLDGMIKQSDFLNPKNLRFLTIHRHGPSLDHGDQILEALTGANLTESEQADVMQGAKNGTIFYLRFLHWILTGEELKSGLVTAEPIRKAG